MQNKGVSWEYAEEITNVGTLPQINPLNVNELTTVTVGYYLRRLLNTRRRPVFDRLGYPRLILFTH